MFLLPTCCNMWLCYCVMVVLFIGFYVGDSDDKVISIKQKSHIKSLFVSMLHQMFNILGILNILGLPIV